MLIIQKKDIVTSEARLVVSLSIKSKVWVKIESK